MLPLEDSITDQDTLPILEITFHWMQGSLYHFDMLAFFVIVNANAILCFFCNICIRNILAS